LPKLYILEYNAKFPPPIKWTIKYDASHSWDLTDYQGASLALLTDLLSEFSYTLMCCNAATGTNAFFIKNEYLSRFADVPKNIDDIFIERRSQLCQRWGQPPSPESVERILLAVTDHCQDVHITRWSRPANAQQLTDDRQAQPAASNEA
jgi:hypothetical protein